MAAVVEDDPDVNVETATCCICCEEVKVNLRTASCLRLSLSLSWFHCLGQHGHNHYANFHNCQPYTMLLCGVYCQLIKATWIRRARAPGSWQAAPLMWALGAAVTLNCDTQLTESLCFS